MDRDIITFIIKKIKQLIEEIFIMKKLNVAVIGCGNISPRHLDSTAALDNANLVAVCDIKEERAKKASEKYNCRMYVDYIEMFEKEQLDVVHICLPHYLHTVVARKAFSYGINVLSEKPMSIDYEDALRTYNLSKEKGLLYSVIFQCRYNTPAKVVKEYIENGKLGKVISAVSTLTWDRSDEYYSLSDWKGTWDKEGGGVVIDQAIHSIDLTNWFIDSDVVSVESALYNRHHKLINVEDTADGIIEYKNGTTYSFFAMNNFATNAPIEIKLVCENGYVNLSYEYADIIFNNGSMEHIVNNKQRIVSYTGGKDYWGTQHAVQINNFYNAVLGKEELEISAEDALKTQKIICEIYKQNKKCE